LESKNFPTTEEGNNWTEVVLRCPRTNWVQALRDFFSQIELHRECLIPHYMIRCYNQPSDSLILEFRVLRKEADEELVKSKIIELLEGYEYQIDPTERDSFYIFHQWIKKGVINPAWTRERCEILSKISRFVLEIISSDTTKEDKEDWGHLFFNMMAMFDILKVYQCPETILSPERNTFKVLKY